MKTTIISLIACGASTLALAAPPDLRPITDATEILKECTRIANEISAVPVPPDHAKAALAAGTNAKVTDEKQKVVIDPAHTQFAQRMESESKRLDACGKKVNPAIANAREDMQALAKKNFTQQEVAAVGPAAAAMQKARDDMQKAIDRLTADKVRQAYVQEALKAHFLGVKP